MTLHETNRRGSARSLDRAVDDLVSSSSVDRRSLDQDSRQSSDDTEHVWAVLDAVFRLGVQRHEPHIRSRTISDAVRLARRRALDEGSGFLPVARVVDMIAELMHFDDLARERHDHRNIDAARGAAGSPVACADRLRRDRGEVRRRAR